MFAHAGITFGHVMPSSALHCTVQCVSAAFMLCILVCSSILSYLEAALHHVLWAVGDIYQCQRMSWIRPHLVRAELLALWTCSLDDEPPVHTCTQACAAGGCESYVVLAWLLGVNATR
jgi:hypothetical protein